MPRFLQIAGSVRVDPGEFDAPELFLGRDHHQNDIVLLDNAVSRRHARILLDGGRWFIEDLESRNRTLINGAPVARRELKEGDRVQIGSVVFVFRLDEGGDDDRVRVHSMAESDSPQAPGTVCARTRIGSIEPESRDLPALEQDQKNLYALYTIGKEINAEIEHIEELLGRILTTAIREVGAERGAIALRDLESGTLKGPEIGLDRSGESIDDLSMSRTIAEDVFRSHRSILTKDALHEEGFARADSIIEARILSAMCVPLLFRRECVGVLYVDNCARTASFSQRDLEFLTCIADLAGIALGNAGLYRRLHQEMSDLRGRLDREVKMVGESEAFRRILEDVKRVAPSEMTVLVTGESGTGKELVARAVHRESARADGPFVAVNCAAIPDTLIESELFGYAANSGIAGAAPKGKPGKFELADKGTIFLDEIGDMKLEVQATILRVLQEKVVERLGGTKPIKVDVRILAATNKNLGEAIRQGRFRQDLFYRLDKFNIAVSPLRERPEDIESLVEHFLERYCVHRKRRPRVTTQAMNLLKRYPWPGNVRELESVVERALLFSGNSIGPDALPDHVRKPREGGGEVFPTLRELEEAHIRKVLDATGGVVARAARILGIARKTLHEKIKVFGIREPSD